MSSLLLDSSLHTFSLKGSLTHTGMVKRWYCTKNLTSSIWYVSWSLTAFNPNPTLIEPFPELNHFNSFGIKSDLKMLWSHLKAPITKLLLAKNLSSFVKEFFWSKKMWRTIFFASEAGMFWIFMTCQRTSLECFCSWQECFLSNGKSIWNGRSQQWYFFHFMSYLGNPKVMPVWLFILKLYIEI